MPDTDTALPVLGTRTRMVDYALAYAQRGWPVFPCVPKSKTPATRHGFKDASTNPAKIREWWARDPFYNIAVATGLVSGLFVFDVDFKEWRSIEEALSAFPALPDAPTVETGGGGFQYFWEYPQGSTLSISGGKLGVGIDTRGEGGYVVVPPSVHPNGRVYRWYEFEDAPLPPTPAWVIERLETQNAKAILSGGEKLKGGRHDTLMTAAAMMRSSGFVTVEIYAALEKLRGRLDLSDGRVIEDKELRDIAEWVGAKDVGQHTIETINEGATIAAHMELGKTAFIAKAHQVPEPHKSPPTTPFMILSASEWAAPLPPRQWLIEGMLPAGGVAFWASEPGKGKSLLAVELAEAIAGGRPFGGFTTKAGNVLYCAPDAPLSMRYRLQGIPVAGVRDRIYFAPAVTVPLDFIRLEAEAKAGGWSVDFQCIIVDTYDRAREHSDGSSAGQDALVQKIVGGARDFADRTGCAIVFLHHSTHAEKTRIRGPQVIAGLCDLIGAVSQELTGTMTLECLKTRDCEPFQPITWDIATRPGLTDETDDVPYLVPSAAQRIGNVREAMKTKAIEDSILEALRTVPPAGKWTDRSLPEYLKIPRTTFQRIVKEMKRKGIYPNE